MILHKSSSQLLKVDHDNYCFLVSVPRCKNMALSVMQKVWESSCEKNAYENAKRYSTKYYIWEKPT